MQSFEFLFKMSGVLKCQFYKIGLSQAAGVFYKIGISALRSGFFPLIREAKE
jgi:hypothetical protein